MTTCGYEPVVRATGRALAVAGVLVALRLVGRPLIPRRVTVGGVAIPMLEGNPAGEFGVTVTAWGWLGRTWRTKVRTGQG